MSTGADARKRVELPGGSTAEVRIVGHTDTGHVRRANEDSFLARFPLGIVADGMGGHEHGARASNAIVETLARLVGDSLPTADDVIGALHDANERVLGDAGAEHRSGSTVTGVCLIQDAHGADVNWLVVNVGDSRVYSWDGRYLEQISVDHSLVQELVDEGLITADQASWHPDRNVITRAVGTDVLVDIDVWLLPANGSQTFLVCSDGITKELGDAQIASILAAHDHEDVTVAEALVEAALAVGGRDNATAVVVEFERDAAFDDHTTGQRSPAILEDTRPRG